MDDAMERAKALGREMQDACGVYHASHVGRVADAIREAERRGMRRAFEQAAALVDHHPFAEGSDGECEAAQGCCEIMAEQIRALAPKADSNTPERET